MISALVSSVVAGGVVSVAAAEEPSVSDQAQDEGFEDQVEAQREDHVREAVEASKKRATPTPESTPER